MLGAVVLAGGRAERLGGVDKAALEVGGRTLLGAVIAAAREVGADQIVVVGPERPVGPGYPDHPGRPDRPGSLPARFVREEPPGSGPVAALRRGLAELGTPRPGDQVAVLAADLPFLRGAHLRTVLAAAAGRNGAVLLDGDGYRQWTIGCWRTAVLADAAAGYPGSSLRGLMAPLEPAQALIDPGPGEAPPWLDCDTETDLSRARAWGQ